MADKYEYVNTPTECLNELKHIALQKGIDKSTIWFYRALLSEMRGNFINALQFLKEAKPFSYNKEMLEFIKDREQFVKSKMPKKLKKKSAKKKKETH